MFTTLALGAFFAHAQFSAPRMQSGVYLNFGAIATLDLTRDGAADLFFPTALAFSMAMSLDENAGILTYASQGWIPAPAYPPGTLAFVTTMTAADFDRDGRDDVAMVSNSGALMIGSNAGHHQVTGQSLQPATVIDFFGPSLIVNPPFVNMTVPAVKAIDVDGDQILDIVFGASPVDVWAGTTNPGFFALYKGTPGGGFQKYTIPTSGNVIDFEWADLNNDGTKDTLVYVTETGSVGAFGYDLHHARFDTTNLLYEINFPANLPQRITSLKVADVSGSPDADYIFGITHPWSGGFSEVQVYEGDGLGNMGSWWSLGLPASTTNVRDQILSMGSEDLNNDGYADLVVLRSFCTPASPGSSASNQYANTEVHVFYGPNIPFVSPVSTTLGGYVQDNWSIQAQSAFLPNRSMPELLRLVDFGGDSVKDILVTCLFGPAPGSTNISPLMATMKNSTLPQIGKPAMVRVGDPSGPIPDNKARAGFDGLPVLGNSNFKGTISDAAPGEVLGYMWGSYGQPNFFSFLGFDFHIAPSEFGYVKVSDSTGFATYDLPIPNNPALVGDVGYFQWNHWNPATGNFGGTQAHQLFIGQ